LSVQVNGAVRKPQRHASSSDTVNSAAFCVATAKLRTLRNGKVNNGATDAPTGIRCHARSDRVAPRENAEEDSIFLPANFRAGARFRAGIDFFDGGWRDGIMRALQEQALSGVGA
jgi:hypothetical protein